MDLLKVLTLDEPQIHMLLSNYKMFPSNVVKLAAKRKVQLDKSRYPLHWQAAALQNMSGYMGGLQQQEQMSSYKGLLGGFYF